MTMKNFFKPLIIIAVIITSIACGDDSNEPQPIPNKHQISTNGMIFSPDSLQVFEGDTIEFIIANGHTATQVDEAAWIANENTPDGGFDFNAGTHQYIASKSDVGTVYYVCRFHISSGMKGKIIVNSKE